MPGMIFPTVPVVDGGSTPSPDFRAAMDAALGIIEVPADNQLPTPAPPSLSATGPEAVSTTSPLIAALTSGSSATHASAESAPAPAESTASPVAELMPPIVSGAPTEKAEMPAVTSPVVGGAEAPGRQEEALVEPAPSDKPLQSGPESVQAPPLPAQPLQGMPIPAPAAELAPTPEAEITLDADYPAHAAEAEQGAAPATSQPAKGSDFADAVRAGDANPLAASPAAPTPGGSAPGLAQSQPLPAPGVAGSSAMQAPHAHPTVTAQPGQIGQQMGVEIARTARAGDEQLTVRLNPIEMGRIEVKLSFDERGTVRAVIAAESAAALEMLRRDSGDLNRALADAGIRSDAQSFRFDSRAGSGEGSQFWQRQQQASQQNGRGYSNASPASEEPAYRPLRTSGQVDLMA
jgi:flagellar hook-length control protein FliK